jgi:cation diffusion facilitator CzcD-associated flavoprotein CzcO
LLEREKTVGGLWAKLPPWQDIQTRAIDWSLNGLPIGGVTQPHILANIQSWVDTFKLHAYIKLNQKVSSVKWLGDRWLVVTRESQFHATQLVSATGLQNIPVTPKTERKNAVVTEYHSFHFKDPDELKGKNVTIVGGSASAFDCIDLALEKNSTKIHWVYRSAKWFLPTHGSKHPRSNVRRLARTQMRVASVEDLSIVIRTQLQGV